MKRKTDDQTILRLHSEGTSQREIAKELGCSKTAIFKRLKKLLQNSGHHANNQNHTGSFKEDDASVHNGPKYYVTQRYIRKIGDDYVYVYTDALMRRGDMEEVRWDGKKFEVVTQKKENESLII
jgi:biotin operon repressor